MYTSVYHECPRNTFEPDCFNSFLIHLFFNSPFNLSLILSSYLAMQVYLLVVRLMKVGENPVSYNTDLSDSSSGEYQKIARLAKEEIEKAYRNTSIKDTYLSSDVNMIKSPSDGDDGVLVNMTVHLAAPRGNFAANNGEDGFDGENEFNLNDMHNELSRTLAISDKSSETLPNPSSIVADIETLEDFDECSDEKYNDCDLAARCINKPGSYVCECKGAYTDMDPNLPGRVCAAEIKNCEACHGRGDCVRSEDGEKTTCKCQRMYLGERCEINGLRKYIQLLRYSYFSLNWNATKLSENF